jgi:hypothetical protein
VQGDAAAILAECDAGRMFDRTMEGALRTHLLDLVRRWQRGDDLRVHGQWHVRYERRALTAELARLVP